MEYNIALIISGVLNCVAAVMNIRQLRRARKMIESNRETFERLLVFAAFMSRPESGAPDVVRNLARQALPEDISIELERIEPLSQTKH